MLRSIDSNEIIQLDHKYIPQNSFLYKLVFGTSVVPVEKDESGAIKVSNTILELNLLKLYLEKGVIDQKHIEKTLEILDYYGIFSLKVEYPIDFVCIKMKEDWFRSNFSNFSSDDSNEIRSITYDLLELNQERIESYKLISDLHYIYSRSIYRKKLQIDVTYITGIEKLNSNQESNNSINSLAYVLHSYPRPYVQHKDVDELTHKIRETTNNFKLRDELFDNHLIRETVRHNRGRQMSKVQYDNYDRKDIEINHNVKKINWKQTYTTILKNINATRICKMLNTEPDLWKNILLAGGSVTNCILACDMTTDYDLFIYGLNEDEANMKIQKCIDIFRKFSAYKFSITRTENSITYISYTDEANIQIQFILRLYSSISEILHGFDIDSSCVGYNGEKIYLTNRANHAFTHLVNMVDFDRMSPTYEYRLSKYMNRGFSVYISDFSWNTINKDKILTYINRDKEYRNERWAINKEISKLKYGKNFRHTSTKEMDPEKIERITKLYEKLHDIYKQKMQKYPTLKGVELLVLSHFVSKGIYRSRLSDYDIDDGISESNKSSDISIRKNYQDEVISYQITKNINEKRRKKGKMEKDKAKEIEIEINEQVKAIFDLNLLKNVEFLVDEGDSINLKRIDSFKIKIPYLISWKKINPGEQVTSTFHRLVLNDISLWYQCRFI